MIHSWRGNGIYLESHNRLDNKKWNGPEFLLPLKNKTYISILLSIHGDLFQLEADENKLKTYISILLLVYGDLFQLEADENKLKVAQWRPVYHVLKVVEGIKEALSSYLWYGESGLDKIIT